MKRLCLALLLILTSAGIAASQTALVEIVTVHMKILTAPKTSIIEGCEGTSTVLVSWVQLLLPQEVKGAKIQFIHGQSVGTNTLWQEVGEVYEIELPKEYFQFHSEIYIIPDSTAIQGVPRKLKKATQENIQPNAPSNGASPRR